jgi:hypothetical protein
MRKSRREVPYNSALERFGIPHTENGLSKSLARFKRQLPSLARMPRTGLNFLKNLSIHPIGEFIRETDRVSIRSDELF